MVKCRNSKRSPCQFMADIRIKLRQIVNRHKQMKTAFTDLRFQIKTGLLEAEDVFTSLSVPLIKLVGLKTDEMAEEGRSSTIFMETDLHHQQESYRKNVTGSETPDGSPFPAKEMDRLQKLKERSYSTRANKVGKELMENQRLQLQKLVYLLRRIESCVNSRQDNILQILNQHSFSLHEFLQKSALYLSDVHRRNQSQETTIVTVLKLLQVTFDNMNLVLGSVEDGVKDLIRELAKHMCSPMVDYVKGLKAEIDAGSLERLMNVVNEMEREMIDERIELEDARKKERLELEDARKKVRIEEQRKLEALCRLRESEEQRRAMKEMVGFLIEAKRKPKGHFLHHKFIDMEEDGDLDERTSVLEVALMKKKNKSILVSQTSPWGTKELLKFVSVKKNQQVNDCNAPPTFETVGNKRPATGSYTRRLSENASCTATWPQLGSSPSMGIH